MPNTNEPKTLEWLREKAKEIYKFNGYSSVPFIVQEHFKKCVKIYFSSNNIHEISASRLVDLLPGLNHQEALIVLRDINKYLFKKASDTTLTLSIKSVYGNDLIYPACEYSKTFAKLVNKKTFSTLDIKLIESLGYNIQYTK